MNRSVKWKIEKCDVHILAAVKKDEPLPHNQQTYGHMYISPELTPCVEDLPMIKPASRPVHWSLVVETLE
ncbi:12996_t:CDS:2 [Acaulospora morrowiae]|uniref:12996_t:CDS:1 n=1 Tax=Acaulospora morrowiae TaxID=94023 RepID=A0A9N9CV60_9GLOM|nr:12996_t:CDS:2 [Acaulospora morrowiae]